MCNFQLNKIGLVSRDYNYRFGSTRDFELLFDDILSMLDKKGCDTVLFSLYTLINGVNMNIRLSRLNLSNIKVVLWEKFTDGQERKPIEFNINYRKNNKWYDRKFTQIFSSLSSIKSRNLKATIKLFKDKIITERCIGNACVFLCGEINGVKYNKTHKRIDDIFNVRRAIPPNIQLILNPTHDKMTRFEMNLKRKFLSANGRVVLSVWNKGKIFNGGKRRDGKAPAWKVFRNGNEYSVKPIQLPSSLRNFPIEIGIF